MKMFWVGALLSVFCGCISQQQIDGTVRVTRDSFRNTEVVRAEMLMRTPESLGATVIVSAERGSPAVLLTMKVASDIRAPYAECFIEAASGTQVIDLPRPNHRTEPLGGGFSLAFEYFSVPLTVAQAETLFRGVPRFRICTHTFLPTATQVQTFHRFWEEYAPQPVPLVRTQ